MADASGEFLGILSHLRRGGPGGAPRVHKPLLLLGLLRRYEVGHGGPVTFREVKEPLTQALKLFGPPVKHVHPHYPFWRLQHDGLWEVVGAEEIPLSVSGDPSPSALTDRHPGRLLARFDEVVKEQSDLRADAQQQLLSDYFPADSYASIRRATAELWS
jgi:putative restriction endonuclease